jgi:hypothetical protein
VRRAGIVGGAGLGALGSRLRTDAGEVKFWYDEACGQFGMGVTNREAILPGHEVALPSRIVNNLACCAAGLRLLEKLCALQGLPWHAVFDIPMSACLQYLGFAAREYLLDGATTNRGIVEQSLEIMARMGLAYGFDWKPLENDTLVAINLKRCNED